MREPRNPFRMRTSEHIESDATFVRLFCPTVLDVLPKENPWDRVHIFRSAPGGGKTTLFRAFTPGPLHTLHNSRANDDLKILYQRMKHLGTVSEDDGPQLLGILLSCGRNYASLEDLALDSTRKERLLYALLNARLILAALRGALLLKKRQYPDDLHLLRVNGPPDIDVPLRLPIPGSGKDLHEWACAVENGVCETIDSFGPVAYDGIEGHEELHAPKLIRPECILYENRPIAGQTLVMLDDVHKLALPQRQKLLATLLDSRPPVGVWVAERLEALSSNEILSTGATTGRDYAEPINLEDFWRLKSNPKRFENVVVDIADRRASSTHDVQVGAFASCLQESLDGSEWRTRFERAIEVISTRVRKRVGSTERYQEWVQTRETMEGTPRDRAIAWRILEILIERDLRKSQLSFNFYTPPLPVTELRDEASAIRGAAEFLVAEEFALPHYFGISRLATLSSSNIDQFLAFSGDLFEVIVSAALLRGETALAPERQESVLKRVAQIRWQEIPRRVPNGRDVYRFLEAIRECAQWETARPSAPYPPGVTGIAVTMDDRDRLINPSTRTHKPEYDRLALVLSSCISYNLLEPSLDRSQGQKGKTWMILYLNRWLCLHFGLPLQYGGWRPKSLAELTQWLERGFGAPEKNAGAML